MSSPKTLSTLQLQTIFGVSHMAIQAWRKGSAKREPLQTITIKDQPRTVAFSAGTVKAWAKKNKVTIIRPVDEVLAAAPAAPVVLAKVVRDQAAKKPATAKVASKAAAVKAKTATKQHAAGLMVEHLATTKVASKAPSKDAAAVKKAREGAAKAKAPEAVRSRPRSATQAQATA